MIPELEISSAISIGKSLNVKHQIIDLDILSIDKIKFNSPERCYYCKTVILNEITGSEGFWINCPSPLRNKQINSVKIMLIFFIILFQILQVNRDGYTNIKLITEK